MPKIHTEFLTDENGNKKAVVVPIDQWQQIEDYLEELTIQRLTIKLNPSHPNLKVGGDDFLRGWLRATRKFSVVRVPNVTDISKSHLFTLGKVGQY